MHGSGKSTFALRYLLNAPAACRFVFDDYGQAAARLKMPHASTAHELEAALATRWVLFNPHRMFAGKLDDAFRFFCRWVMETSRRGPGKKLVLVDEVWRFCTPNYIPEEFAEVAQIGRADGVELVSATQVPHKLNSSLTGMSTELVCFRLDERLALECVRSLGMDPAQVQELPLGSFIARNRLTRGQLTGKLF